MILERIFFSPKEIEPVTDLLEQKGELVETILSTGKIKSADIYHYNSSTIILKTIKNNDSEEIRYSVEIASDTNGKAIEVDKELEKIQQAYIKGTN